MIPSSPNVGPKPVKSKRVYHLITGLLFIKTHSAQKLTTEILIDNQEINYSIRTYAQNVGI